MKFEEWFNQQEGYGTRAERFYEDLEWNDPQQIKDWLLAAYNEGLREGLATPSVTAPVIPTWPNPMPCQDMKFGTSTNCSKCGINLTGVMGYVCSDMNCPTFRNVWSGTMIPAANVQWQSYNISNVFGTKSDEGYNG